jgi:hypothetical protein
MSLYFASLEKRDSYMPFDSSPSPNPSLRRRLDDIAISEATLEKKRDINVQRVEHDRSVRAGERSMISSIHHASCMEECSVRSAATPAQAPVREVAVEELGPINYIERLKEEENRIRRLAAADGGIKSLYGVEGPTQPTEASLHKAQFHFDQADGYSSGLKQMLVTAKAEEASSKVKKSGELMQRLVAQPRSPCAVPLHTGVISAINHKGSDGDPKRPSHPIDMYHAHVRADLMRRSAHQ